MWLEATSYGTIKEQASLFCAIPRYSPGNIERLSKRVIGGGLSYTCKTSTAAVLLAVE
jgi:hypothetical protein